MLTWIKISVRPRNVARNKIKGIFALHDRQHEKY
jgi:hypothetical protein